MDVLSIPIYRCSEEEHSRQMETDKKNLVKYCQAIKGSRAEKIIENSFENEKWYPWEYNEIIGWVNLEFSGEKVTAELWSVNKKISKRTVNKRYYDNGKAFEVFLNHENRQIKIAKRIFNSFIDWWERSEFIKKRRYINVDQLRANISLINWLRLKRASYKEK